jgi:hypothetical protein
MLPALLRVMDIFVFSRTRPATLNAAAFANVPVTLEIHPKQSPPEGVASSTSRRSIAIPAARYHIVCRARSGQARS